MTEKETPNTAFSERGLRDTAAVTGPPALES